MLAARRLAARPTLSRRCAGNDCPQVSLLFAKRKQISAEVKAKKREKEDAEKHAKALEELVS